MENDKRLHEYYEKSGTLMKLAIFGGGLNLIGVVVVIWLGITATSKYGSWAGSDIFALMVLPFAIAMLYSIAAAIYGSMGKSAFQEEEDKLNLEKRKEGQSAFNVNEDVRFTAGRAFKNFQKYSPYVIAGVSMITIFAIVFSFWSMWQGRQAGVTPVPVNALFTLVISLVFMIASLFSGAFFIGQSRDSAYRWLRPVGAWMIAGFIVALLSTIGALYYYYKMPQPNMLLAKIVFVAFIVLGCELIFSFISEFYRPRSLEVPRPVFESRILALFTEPGGVARNIANMLDYQFGFKVSGTWIYGFLERALFPILIAWFFIIWAFTCIAQVGPNEVGVRMTFGKISKDVLDSGVYMKLPFPFGKILTYSCDEIHRVNIGAIMIDEQGKETRPDVVAWGKAHYGKEVSYLVASETSDRNSAPVSQLGSSIPVQYRIKKDKLIDYAFRNQNSDEFLKNIGEQVVSKYFASVSIFDIMSSGRAQASIELHKRLQAEADRLELGIEIVRVNIHDSHPPTEVAPEFQAVVNAIEEIESGIFKAKAYANVVKPATEAESARLVAEAEAYAYQVGKVAQAESLRFEKQLNSYKVLPDYFMLRTFLDMFEQEAGKIRKYILSSSLEYEVYEFNFEKKAQLDLIDADLENLSR